MQLTDEQKREIASKLWKETLRVHTVADGYDDYMQHAISTIDEALAAATPPLTDGWQCNVCGEKHSPDDAGVHRFTPGKVYHACPKCEPRLGATIDLAEPGENKVDPQMSADTIESQAGEAAGAALKGGGK
jgi:hypothetical protein